MERRIETGADAVKAVLDQIRQALLNPDTKFIFLTHKSDEVKTISNMTCEGCKAALLIDVAQQIAERLPEDYAHEQAQVH